MIQVDGIDQQEELLRDVVLRDVYKLRSTPPAEVEAFVDVGANIGYASIMARMLFPKARILAVEPALKTYSALEDNTLGLDIDLFLAALSKSDRVRVEQWPTSLQNRVVEDIRGDCVGVSLEELLTDYPLDKTFLKVDIEGGESALVGEAEEDLLRQVRNLALELHYQPEDKPKMDQWMDQVFSQTHEWEVTDFTAGHHVIRLRRL